jgi:hypothetical protein
MSQVEMLVAAHREYQQDVMQSKVQKILQLRDKFRRR